MNSQKPFLIAVGSLVGLLAVIIFSQISLNIPFIRPTASETTILLFVLSMVVSLAFVVFGFILTRNVVKLWTERRARILGSKFKFKLVAGALALSLLPVMFLFYSSYALMNRTLDKWFRQPFERVTHDTREIITLLSNYASAKTESDARGVAAALTGVASGVDPQAVLEEVADLHDVSYLALLGPGGEKRAQFPTAGPDLARAVATEDYAARRPVRRVLSFAGAEFAIAVLPQERGGWLIAANRLPGYSAKLVEMQRELENYNRLSREFKDVRKVYINILALVTVIILFITTWMALFLSKQVTVPIQSLAEATREVSLGHLDHRIRTSATDELGALVESFNRMTAQLEVNRKLLVSSRSELERANAELDQRSRFTEAILENIPTGVISLSPARQILKINPAVERLLGPERTGAARELRDLFPEDDLRELERLLKRSHRMGAVTAQFDLTGANRKIGVAITVSSLENAPSSRQKGREQNLGYILVIEDMSDVLHAQQAAAWREVAQRIAHEIKNPLTPIALSAERIRRHIERTRASTLQADSLRVIQECSTLIEQEVGTLKDLVNEFAQLARFPAAHPAPTNVNGVIETALAVFNGRLDGIQLRLDLADALPQVNVDPDQFKRVIVNLVDNAAEAMTDSLVREIRISTADLRGEAVEVTVADTGHGVSPELKEKLFLPYFSTKRRGTGLGLAIVSRFIDEHKGSIRVEENEPVGARFIIELPVEEVRSQKSEVRMGPTKPGDSGVL